MSIPTTTMIAIAGLRETAKQPGSLRDRLVATMREAHNHWLVTNEEEQFKAAVGAVMMETEGEEREEVVVSMAALTRAAALLNALIAGVPVDMDQAMADAPPAPPPYQLRELWIEAKP